MVEAGDLDCRQSPTSIRQTWVPVEEGEPPWFRRAWLVLALTTNGFVFPKRYDVLSCSSSKALVQPLGNNRRAGRLILVEEEKVGFVMIKMTESLLTKYSWYRILCGEVTFATINNNFFLAWSFQKKCLHVDLLINIQLMLSIHDEYYSWN